MDNEYDQNGWDEDDAVYDSDDDHNVAFDSDDDDDEAEVEDDTENGDNCRPKKDYEINEKTMPPIMFDFEKSNIIRARIVQLNKSITFKYNGADVLSKVMNEIKERGLTSSKEIAEYEFSTGNLPPYKYYRRNFNGSYEIWRHEDFEFFPQ